MHILYFNALKLLSGFFWDKIWLFLVTTGWQPCCTPLVHNYEAPFVKILYPTDLAQKLLSLRIYSYLCVDLAISVHV